MPPLLVEGSTFKGTAVVLAGHILIWRMLPKQTLEGLIGRFLGLLERIEPRQLYNFCRADSLDDEVAAVVFTVFADEHIGDEFAECQTS